jgi:cytochrome P450
MDSIVENFPVKPDHVPAELVWNSSLERFAQEQDDPFLSISRLHDGPDIIWSSIGVWGKPAWILTRAAHMQEAYMDYEHFSAQGASDISELLSVDWKLNPVQYDPPMHIHYRKILNPWFTPIAVNALDAKVREVCNTLLEKFENSGSCEFIADFASLFPAHIFLALMGLPASEVDQFLEWEHAFLKGETDAGRIAAAREIVAYLQKCCDDRRANPRDDLITAIVTSKIRETKGEERLLNDDEIMGMCYVLYLGGLDTVMSSLGWIFRHLVGDKPLQDRLRANPADVMPAIGELMRAYAPAISRRVIAKDLEFHNVPFKKGEYVVLATYLAGRDDRAYKNPHVIDIDRGARTVSFGYGVHNCLGIHLARREMKIVIEAFLSRFDNLHLPANEQIEIPLGENSPVWGVTKLPLTWDKRALA